MRKTVSVILLWSGPATRRTEVLELLRPAVAAYQEPRHSALLRKRALQRPIHHQMGGGDGELLVAGVVHARHGGVGVQGVSGLHVHAQGNDSGASEELTAGPEASAGNVDQGEGGF